MPRNPQHFQQESELDGPVAEFLRMLTFQFQVAELPFFEYRIDRYGYSKSADMTVAVELKLTRWKRAAEQALIYQLCADLVYIAMPAANAKKVDAASLQEHGIGLIAVEPSLCTRIVASRRSKVVNRKYRDAYITVIGEPGAEVAARTGQYGGGGTR